MGRNYEQDRSSIRERVLSKGCYSPEENQRIYDKWFARAPRFLFRAVDRKYGISGKDLCDIGCTYGMNLVFCNAQSYGIEIADYATNFARSIGLTVHNRNIVQDQLADLPQVDVVWCSAVMEHVDSPHILLRKLGQLLRPDGMLVIYVPTIPLIKWLRHIPGLRRMVTGYLYPDHINAFVPETLQFFCERAGFKTLEVSPFYPSALGIFNRVPVLNRLKDGCIYIGRKIPGWEYPPKATRRVADNETGFTFVDDFYDPSGSREAELKQEG